MAIVPPQPPSPLQSSVQKNLLQALKLVGGGAVVVYGLDWATQPSLPPQPTDALPAVTAPQVAPAANGFVQAQKAAAALRVPDGVQDLGYWLEVEAASPRPPSAMLLAWRRQNEAPLQAFDRAMAMPQWSLVPPEVSMAQARSARPPSQLKPLRQLAKLGLLAFRDDLQAGHHAAALAHWRAVLLLGRRLAHAPGSVTAVQAQGLVVSQAAWDALRLAWPQVQKAPPEALAQLAQAIEDWQALEQPLPALLVGDREAALAWLKADNEAPPRAYTSEGPDPLTRWLKWRTDPSLDWPRRHLDAQLKSVAQRRFGLLEEQRTEWRQVPKALVSLRQAIHPSWGTWVALVSQVGADAERNAHAHLLEQARGAGVRVGLAAWRYQQDQGQAPASFQALVPSYLASWPLDPYAPRHPLPSARGRVWSVGWDGHDDQLRTQPSRASAAGGSVQTDDRGDLLLWPAPKVLLRGAAVPDADVWLPEGAMH